MGNLLSPRFPCQNHRDEEAVVFCVAHKVFVCLACIISRAHFESTCDMLEMKKLEDDSKQCLEIRETVRKKTNKLMGSEKQRNLERKIDEAYNIWSARYQGKRETTHAEMQKKLNDARINNAAILELIDKILHLVRMNRGAEVEALVMQLKSKSVCIDLKVKKLDYGNEVIVNIDVVQERVFEYMDRSSRGISSDQPGVADRDSLGISRLFDEVPNEVPGRKC